ncbi:TetR/AcrR family transcriptional regulator [Nocardia goodfellowii]|uniref:AcrR family transcriptional regulator n=1 Tax=Nocardia goodfellowii TaxID=882446 RepID=A0ABS4QH28_9NOCA|nr:TetR/AcrR family transcriptional regulator [Nocardia goodfellowii]MBP2190888.1 AcrR family transcriptional regulator [Nocardia goodfellowii]
MPTTRRAHTGSRRNEQARAAILSAATELLAEHGTAGVTIDRLAAHAGVGRQTIYRWWSSKDAVLLDALVHSADHAVPSPDTGSLRTDLEQFLRATFEAAGTERNRRALLTAAIAAQDDPSLADALDGFLTQRRTALTELIERARTRGEVPATAAVDLAVEQAFGVLWYRLLFRANALQPDTATDLATALDAQLRASA